MVRCGSPSMRRLIPSEAVEQPVGLGPPLVEVAEEPEAQEAGQRALQVERAARDGHRHPDQRERRWRRAAARAGCRSAP